MILITGGLGFIGTHTARALVDLGESCILTKHVSADVPTFIKDDIGERVFIAPVDLTDRNALLGLGETFHVTGIVHLGAGIADPFTTIRNLTLGFLNTLEAANAWNVNRVCVASSIGVYSATSEPDANLREDAPIPISPTGHIIPAVKKCEEILAEQLARDTDVECVVMRLAGIYGPRYRGRYSVPARLVHAAVRGQPVDLDGTAFGSAPDDGFDWCYVKDCARGIALLQTAPTLHHRTYNVGSGRASTNRDVLAAVRQAVADANLSMPGADDPGPARALPGLDITRMRDDTAYQPDYGLIDGIADYVSWLQRGNAF